VRYPAVLALTALAASSCGVGVHFANNRYQLTPPDAHVAGPVDRIVVKSDSGHVRVTTGGGNGVTIHRVVHYQSGHPRPGQQLSGGTLTFTRGCRNCDVDYDLTVPASVNVSATIDSGSVNIAGVANVTARADSGSLTIRQVTGNVTADSDSATTTIEHVKGAVTSHTDSGKQTITDVGGALSLAIESGGITGSALRSPTAHVTSESGGVRLLFSSAPRVVEVHTETGGAHVAVPGGPFNVSTKSEVGGADVSVPTDPNAGSRISVHTETGHIVVEPS
jgi:hypothetical protein